MKKFMFVLSILFTILTFVGAGYVFYTGGQANAGYACVPILFCLVFSNIYRFLNQSKSS